MGFIHTGYIIPSNGAIVKYSRINEVYISQVKKEASFVIAYYADFDACSNGLEPIISSSSYYIYPHEFDAIFPKGQPYEANLYTYIANTILVDQGWTVEA